MMDHSKQHCTLKIRVKNSEVNPRVGQQFDSFESVFLFVSDKRSLDRKLSKFNQ